MNTIINKIMFASEYPAKSFEGIPTYYSRNDSSFFFTLQYSLSEIAALKKYTEFTEEQKYKDLLRNFQILVKDGLLNTVEKNSSLIVLVKCDSLNAIEKYHQQILLLEEDEYFFKKYVIFYTEDVAATLNSKDNLLEYLHEKLNDEESFGKYAEKGFIDDIADYIMVLQLFIKLPLLKVKIGDEEYKTLNDKISETLGENDEAFMNWIIQSENSVADIDFMQEGIEENIDSILSHLPNDQS